jgi:hypothetical protein
LLGFGKVAGGTFSRDCSITARFGSGQIGCTQLQSHISASGSMDGQQTSQNNKENARSASGGSKRVSQAATSFSHNGAQWDGSQIPASAYQRYPRDWQPATDQHFVSAPPIYASINSALGFSQNAFDRDPTLLQSSMGYYGQTISPQALQSGAVSGTLQVYISDFFSEKTFLWKIILIILILIFSLSSSPLLLW